MNWQLIDNNEMERIHVREMHRDFPPGELKGVDVMERLRADGCYWPYACYDEAGRLLAYAFLCGLPGEPNCWPGCAGCAPGGGRASSLRPRTPPKPRTRGWPSAVWAFTPGPVPGC